MNWKKIAVAGLLIIVLVPVLVNIIMQIRLPWNIVYDGDWLGFFGAFFGAVFTVIGALIVVYINNSRKNKSDYSKTLIKLRIAYNEFNENNHSLFLDYKTLISQPDPKSYLEIWLSNERRQITHMYNIIIRLNVFNNIWYDILFNLVAYETVMSNVIETIVYRYLPQNDNIAHTPERKSFYIVNNLKAYDDYLKEAWIDPHSNRNKRLEKFVSSCSELLFSEIKRVSPHFQVK